MKRIDLSGKQFARLHVLEPGRLTTYGARYWRCICDCGNTTEVSGQSLREGHTRSCGCLSVENAGQINFRHGHAHTRLYHIYLSAKKRVTNRKDAAYKNYGGRGIKMCRAWLDDPAVFIHDVLLEIGAPPSGAWIDRINNSGDYAPRNVRWVSPKQSGRNTRHCRYITYNGKTLCLAEWCETLGIPYDRTKARLRYGWTPSDAFEISRRPNGSRPSRQQLSHQH